MRHERLVLTLISLTVWASVVVLLRVAIRLLRERTLLRCAPGDVSSSISIIVAAHNEEPRIGELISSLLAQDHPDFEVIVVDDRSSDGTGQAARRAAAEDARIRILRVNKRPPGWQGPLHAKGVGAAAATRDWLLFLNADQRLAAPDVLRAAASEQEQRGVAALSLIGTFVGNRCWERWWFHPIINNPIFWGVILLVQKLRPRSVWVIGALGMPRATYHELGGVTAAAVCAAGGYDDHGWARVLAAHGKRTRMVYSPDLEDRCNWDDLSAYWQGIRRWAAGIFTYRKGGWLAATGLALAIGLVLSATALVILDLVVWRAPEPAAIALAAIGPTIGFGYCRWNRRSLWFSWAFYAVGALVLITLAGSAWARLRNRVRWRDEEMRIICPAPTEPAPS